VIPGAAKNPDFTRPGRALGTANRLAEQRVRDDISHRVSTAVRNPIAFFG